MSAPSAGRGWLPAAGPGSAPRRALPVAAGWWSLSCPCPLSPGHWLALGRQLWQETATARSRGAAPLPLLSAAMVPADAAASGQPANSRAWLRSALRSPLAARRFSGPGPRQHPPGGQSPPPGARGPGRAGPRLDGRGAVWAGARSVPSGGVGGGGVVPHRGPALEPASTNQASRVGPRGGHRPRPSVRRLVGARRSRARGEGRAERGRAPWVRR